MKQFIKAVAETRLADTIRAESSRDDTIRAIRDETARLAASDPTGYRVALSGKTRDDARRELGAEARHLDVLKKHKAAALSSLSDLRDDPLYQIGFDELMEEEAAIEERIKDIDLEIGYTEYHMYYSSTFVDNPVGLESGLDSNCSTAVKNFFNGHGMDLFHFQFGEGNHILLSRDGVTLDAGVGDIHIDGTVELKDGSRIHLYAVKPAIHHVDRTEIALTANTGKATEAIDSELKARLDALPTETDDSLPF